MKIKGRSDIKINDTLVKIYGSKYYYFKKAYDYPDTTSDIRTIIIEGRFELTKFCPLQDLCTAFYRRLRTSPLQYQYTDESGDSYLKITPYTSGGDIVMGNWDVELVGFVVEQLYEINRLVESHKVDTFFGIQRGYMLMKGSVVIWIINALIIFVSRHSDPHILVSRLLFLTSVIFIIFIFATYDYMDNRSMFAHIHGLE